MCCSVPRRRGTWWWKKFRRLWSESPGSGSWSESVEQKRKRPEAAELCFVHKFRHAAACADGIGPRARASLDKHESTIQTTIASDFNQIPDTIGVPPVRAPHRTLLTEVSSL